jgi:hypothetical protein
MKKIYFLALAYGIIQLHGIIAQEVGSTPQQAQLLLSKIDSNLKAHGLDNPDGVIEGGSHPLQKLQEFTELQSQMNSSWSQAMNVFQNVAPSDTSKAVFLLAAESSLSSENYLQFLNQTVELVQNKIIDKQFLHWAIFPADKNVRGVLVYNYTKPIVKDILQKVKVLYADDPNMLNYCNAVLSGDAKKTSEDYYGQVPSDSKSAPAIENSSSSLRPVESETSSPLMPTSATTTSASTQTVANPPSVSTSANWLIILGVFLIVFLTGRRLWRLWGK